MILQYSCIPTRNTTVGIQCGNNFHTNDEYARATVTQVVLNNVPVLRIIL